MPVSRYSNESSFSPFIPQKETPEFTDPRLGSPNPAEAFKSGNVATELIFVDGPAEGAA